MIVFNAKAEARKGNLRSPQLRRVISLACQSRRLLVLGLLCTIIYACLQTGGLSGAYPVFKILLDEEGLQGLADRFVAGHRLGVEFAPAGNAKLLRVNGVDSGGEAHRQGVRAGDALRDPSQASAGDSLHAIAHAETGQGIAFETQRLGEDGPEAARAVTLAPTETPLWMLALQRVTTTLLDIAGHDRFRTLAIMVAALGVVVIVANVFRFFGEVMLAKVVLIAMMRLRTRLYERSLYLPLAFFAKQPTADIVGRFVTDFQEIQRGLLTLFSKFVREPLRALFFLGLAFVLDWRMTLAMVVIGPVTISLFWKVGRSVKKANRKLLQAYGQMIDQLTASLQSLRVVKAYTAEDHERRRLLEVDQRVLKQNIKLARLDAMTSPMMETLTVIGGSLVTLWFASRVIHQELSPSKFAALGVTLTMLFDPLRKLSDVYVRLQRAAGGAERIYDVLDEPIEQVDSDEQAVLRPLAKSIDYVDVSFTYPGAETPALHHVNLSIRQGETVAIVGPNGCGKTTLVNLLPRFFDPTSGTILYDGVDLREATLRSLRDQIGLVTQDAVVFAGSPAENIAYGQSAAQADGLVREAARRASADEFILNIPGGYEAELNERGGNLSGGQRQRLSIARAIFRDAPILIFDEATSQIDTESELKIQTALKELAKNRTTLIIAHRLSTIQFAGRIVVMDAGRILDTGTHRELFDRCTLYRSLCETQFVTERTETPGPAS